MGQLEDDRITIARIDGSAGYVVASKSGEFETLEQRVACVRAAATQTVSRRTVVRADLITQAAASCFGALRARPKAYPWAQAKLELLEAAGADPAGYEPTASEVAARLDQSGLGGIGNP